jgi:hypothetical protein
MAGQFKAGPPFAADEERKAWIDCGAIERVHGVIEIEPDAESQTAFKSTPGNFGANLLHEIRNSGCELRLTGRQ